MPEIADCPKNNGLTNDGMDCVEKQTLKENITTKGRYNYKLIN
jgi:hypothetical protein